jgi:2-polyprenyl-3-methyl-5-hydroxy-6-metoxy-1,4-benzoquinol methylase
VDVAEQFEQINSRLIALEQGKTDWLTVKEMIRSSILLPPLDQPALATDAPFMQHSNCMAQDFQHPRYFQLCKLIEQRPTWHRKQWEYVFILHHLERAGMLRPGKRGVGFGVGIEPLPSAFAQMGARVLGTDAPAEIGQSAGWVAGNEHSQKLSDMRMGWIPNDLFEARVCYQPCDMNSIDPDIRDFDFAWSSCCFEHLGTIEKGLDFVRNSVEQCLKPGGIAVHTTELNMSSDADTVEESIETVLYRKSDLITFVDEMRNRGHDVAPVLIGQNAHALDFHVDVPPYSHNPHIRLQLAGYVTTSIGLLIRRGV